MNDRTVWKHPNDLTIEKKKKVMESIIFLSEKTYGAVKGLMCTNGSTQRSHIPREKASRPTVTTESVLMTRVIDAKQDIDVMSMDVPSAFVQTESPQGDERIIMKIRGALVDILLEIDPEKHKDFAIGEGRNKVPHARMLKSSHGMLMASILCYNKFRENIEAEGYKVNPHDICVAKKITKGKQHALTWHVDDAKTSHVDSKVNDKFCKWAKKKHDSD